MKKNEEHREKFDLIQKGINSFLQKEFPDISNEVLLSNSKKKKIPLRLVPKFLEWFMSPEQQNQFKILEQPSDLVVWPEVVAENFPAFELPSNDRLSGSFNPQLHHVFLKTVNNFLKRSCTEEELKLITTSNRRRKVIPRRLCPEFIVWFRKDVVGFVNDFLDSNKDEEIKEIIDSGISKIPLRLVTRFISVFSKTEEETHGEDPVLQYLYGPKNLSWLEESAGSNISFSNSNSASPRIKSKKRKISKEFEPIVPIVPSTTKFDHAHYDSAILPYDNQLDYDVDNWVDLIQNGYPDFDFPAHEDERRMYSSELCHQIDRCVASFISRNCSDLEKGYCRGTKNAMIPSRLSDAFLIYFKANIIDKTKVVKPVQDMYWKDILKEHMSDFELPSHQLSARYESLLKGIDFFLQKNCSTKEMSKAASNNVRRVKIPARLVPTFISWFRKAERVDFETITKPNSRLRARMFRSFYPPRLIVQVAKHMELVASRAAAQNCSRNKVSDNDDEVLTGNDQILTSVSSFHSEHEEEDMDLPTEIIEEMEGGDYENYKVNLMDDIFMDGCFDESQIQIAAENDVTITSDPDNNSKDPLVGDMLLF